MVENAIFLQIFYTATATNSGNQKPQPPKHHDHTTTTTTKIKITQKTHFLTLRENYTKNRDWGREKKEEREDDRF